MRQVILDARAIPGIDVTAAEQLEDYINRLRARGIDFVVAKAHLPLREKTSAMSAVLGGCCRFSQIADAVAAFKNEQPASAS